MARQDELKIHIKINSRYRIFDPSGDLPFSIIFGLCRRSPSDTDSRYILLDTSSSGFDAPHAFANGLLQLFESEEKAEVDLRSFQAKPCPRRILALPPPGRRGASKLDDFNVVLNDIDSKSELARLLKPSTMYEIRFASTDLGVKWWTYSDSDEIPSVTLVSESVSEAAKLANSRESAGKAGFKTCNSLPCPPALNFRFKLRSQRQSSSNAHDDNYSRDSVARLEVSSRIPAEIQYLSNPPVKKMHSVSLILRQLL